MQCLEELCASSNDSEGNKVIEEEIAALSQSYDWYNILLGEIQVESELYHFRYAEIQRRIYKELRRVRNARKRHNKDQTNIFLGSLSEIP